MQGFLGFANFYRRFIKGFSKAITPLVILTKKKTPFSWDDAYQKAFDLVKKKVTSALCFRHFDFCKTAILETDAFDKVIGGILVQKDDDGILHPMAFYSKILGLVKINYHIYNKKLLIIIKCFEYWRPELENIDLLIQAFIDYKVLLTFAKKDPKDLIRK